MSLSLFWFRRDLRLHDNHGLYEALKGRDDVLPLFIFDTNILEELHREDPRVGFIHQEVSNIKQHLKSIGKEMVVRHGIPSDVWTDLLQQFDVSAVYTNHDYEPYARWRDHNIKQLLDDNDVTFHSYKDHVIYENDEIQKAAGGIYTVFSPYKRKWLTLFEEEYLSKGPSARSRYPSEELLQRICKDQNDPPLSLHSIGFVKHPTIEIPSRDVARKVVKLYHERRDYPGLEDSTSRLGIHFRFGTISIRQKAVAAASLSEVYLSELIWRDFYAQILANFPHVVERAFRPKYDRIPWRDNAEEFDKWCRGVTGYPIVDAGMRELNTTGYMHNRVRMITASFLTKHLLMDWRKGEAYFAERLLDYDLASNNGGWQWASGSGTDAAPYFRIFNPTSQMEKFDKERAYIKRWIPEYDTPDYPDPMVDHRFARARCLETYKKTLSTA